MAKVEKKTSIAAKPTATAKKEEAVNTEKSWFSKGDAGLARKHQQDKLAAARKEKGAPRFYLKHTPGDRGPDGPKDNESRIVFLDSAGFWVFEHNIKIEGKWGNFATCTKDFQPCEICSQLSDKPVYTCYFTVIDTRRWPKKDGTISKPRRVLFPAKGSAIDVIEKLKEKHGDLRGLVVDVSRIGDRDPNCGRDFDVVMKDGRVVRVDPAKRFPEKDESKPFDYMKILAPPTQDELAALGVTAQVSVGSDDDIDDDDEEVVQTKKNGKKKIEEPSEEELDDLVGD